MEPLAAKTVTDILGVVRNVIRYINTRYQRLDCDLSQITIKKEESRMRILSREEEEQLIRYLMEYRSPMNCGIFLTLFTGLRIGELCALTWGDIHLRETENYAADSKQTADKYKTIPKADAGSGKRKTDPDYYHSAKKQEIYPPHSYSRRRRPDSGGVSALWK